MANFLKKGKCFLRTRAIRIVKLELMALSSSSVGSNFSA